MIYILTLAILLALLIDCRQTLRIKDHPMMWEINPLLGRHPIDARIVGYFLLCAALFVAGMVYTPAPWHWLWLAGWSVMEGWAIWNNIEHGLGL